jgi:hypothetical protein
MIEPYVKVFVCELTGIKTTYTYNGSSIVSGIMKAEFEYPKEYLDKFNRQEKIKANLPKTKQMYLNPKTGREVSYYRAKALGLVK